MPQWKDKEDFLSNLYDHIMPDNPTDEDEDWFDHVSSFFNDPDNDGGNNGGNNSGQSRFAQRRSAGNQGGNQGGNSGGNRGSNRPPGPRRQRRTTSTGYGSSAWFGSGS